MNRITKFALGAAVIAPALIASSAFAATIPATTIFNGQTEAWGNAGQSVQATFRVNVAAGEVVHAIRTKVDSQATVCTPIGPFEGAQDVDVTVNPILPPNSNTSGYNLTAELFTTATVPQAQALTGNLACTGANTNAYNGTNVLHVLPVSGSTSGSGGTVSGSNDMASIIANAIAAAFAKFFPSGPTPTPTVDPLCAQLPSTSNVTALQVFLMSNGQAIPAISAGAAYGYFGTQTATALSNFKIAHKCS